MACLEPPLHSVPIGDWFYVVCQPNHINQPSKNIGNEEILMNLYDRSRIVPGRF